MSKKLWLFICIVIVMLLNVSIFIACDTADISVITLQINDSGINFSSTYNYMSWDKVEGASHYKISAYPIYNRTQEVYSDDTSTNLCYIPKTVLYYQDLVFYITAYNDDYSVSSTSAKYYLTYKNGDVVVPDNGENDNSDLNHSGGVVDGYMNEDYYYVDIKDRFYLLNTTTKDYAIVLDSDKIVTNVSAIGLTSSQFTQSDKLLIINNSYVKQFTAGCRIPIEITYEDGAKSECVASVISKIPYELEKYELTHTIGLNSTQLIKLKEGSTNTVKAVTIDGIYIKSLYTTNGSYITILEKALNCLALGTHEVRIYFNDGITDLGYASVKLIVKSNIKTPQNVCIDFDSEYDSVVDAPKVYIKWDSYVEYSEVSIKIGEVIYSNQNSSFADLFSDGRFDATGKIYNAGTNVVVTGILADNSSCSSETVTLSENLSNADLKTHLKASYTYLGVNYNNYISNEAELNAFAAYNVINYGDSDLLSKAGESYDMSTTYTICAPYLCTQSSTEETVKVALVSAYESFIEPVNSKITINSVENSLITYTIQLWSGSCRPYQAIDNNTCGKDGYYDYVNSELHYGNGTRSSAFDNFAVNSIEETCEVSTSVELFIALSEGLKPIPSGSALAVYDKAKEVLREIIDDEMSDYEKVLAIYDWITYNVVYDYKLEAYVSNKSLINGKDYTKAFKYRSYYAEGVFFDGLAQCNGIAAAFSIMCNIEGIKCYKIMGKVSGAHAWNKVYVNDEWYVCDPTWSNVKEPLTHREYISYETFMLSNIEINDRKTRTEAAKCEGTKRYAGDGQFDYWASDVFTYENNVYDHVIESYDELQVLISYYTQTGLNAVLSQHEIKQISVKANIYTIKAWMKTISYVESRFNIYIFAMTDSTGAYVKEHENVTYIRITYDVE